MALFGAGVVALALWQRRVLVGDLESEELGAVQPRVHAPLRSQQSVLATVILLLIGVTALVWILIEG
jgi:hypothetical protein